MHNDLFPSPWFEHEPKAKSFTANYQILTKLMHDFWTQFVAELVPAMRKYSKWAFPKYNLQVGDVCLLLDPGIVGTKTTPMVRVLEAIKGNDGLVRKCWVICQQKRRLVNVHRLVILLKNEDEIRRRADWPTGEDLGIPDFDSLEAEVPHEVVDDGFNQIDDLVLNDLRLVPDPPNADLVLVPKRKRGRPPKKTKTEEMLKTLSPLYQNARTTFNPHDDLLIKSLSSKKAKRKQKGYITPSRVQPHRSARAGRTFVVLIAP